jgi:hypothetical protein
VVQHITYQSLLNSECIYLIPLGRVVGGWVIQQITYQSLLNSECIYLITGGKVGMGGKGIIWDVTACMCVN